MLVIEIKAPGGPDALVPAERPRPVPAAGGGFVEDAGRRGQRPHRPQRSGHHPPPPGGTGHPRPASSRGHQQNRGAERCINYREEDFVAVMREATGGKGVDVVLDMVGGDYVPRSMEALALEGRLVSIAFIAGSIKAQINIFTMMQKRLTLTGSTLRARSVAEKGAIAAGLKAHVWPLFEARKVTPVIHATFPLRDAAAAHRVMEAGTHIGKLVL